MRVEKSAVAAATCTYHVRTGTTDVTCITAETAVTGATARGKRLTEVFVAIHTAFRKCHDELIRSACLCLDNRSEASVYDQSANEGTDRKDSNLRE